MITVPQFADVAYRDPILFEALRRIVAGANSELSDIRESISGAGTAEAPSSMWFNVMDYGAKGDATTIDTTAIVDAIADASEKGGIVYFPTPPGGKYLINSGFVIGNGTSTAASTINGVILLGETPEVTLEWLGASTSGAVIRILGPIRKSGIVNLTIDCVGASIYGIWATHPASCTFRSVEVRQPSSVGWQIDAHSNNPGNISPRNNGFYDCGTVSVSGVARVGWRIGSNTVGLPPYAALTHNVFVNCYANMTSTPVSTGFEFGYCYSNRFVDTMITGAWKPIVDGVVAYPNGGPVVGTDYPQANEFFGLTAQGGTMETYSGWTGRYPNIAWPFRTIGETAPTQAQRNWLGITSEGIWIGKPRGNPLRFSTKSLTSTVTNPATATTFGVTHTIESYALHQEGAVLKLYASGSCDIADPTTLAIGFALGSTLVWYASTAGKVTATTHSWFAEASFTVASIGTSGVIRRDMGLIACSSESATPTAGSPVALNTTSSYLAAVQVTIGTPNAGTTVTCNNLRVEITYPKETA